MTCWEYTTNRYRRYRSSVSWTATAILSLPKQPEIGDQGPRQSVAPGPWGCKPLQVRELNLNETPQPYTKIILEKECHSVAIRPKNAHRTGRGPSCRTATCSLRSWRPLWTCPLRTGGPGRKVHTDIRLWFVGNASPHYPPRLLQNFA